VCNICCFIIKFNEKNKFHPILPSKLSPRRVKRNFNKRDVIPSKKGQNFIVHCRRRLGETRAEMYFF
jgi:hypothetical protein